MTVGEFVRQLQQFDPDKYIYVMTYYVEEDYDWDETLELNYRDSIAEPFARENKDGSVCIEAGEYLC